MKNGFLRRILVAGIIIFSHGTGYAQANSNIIRLEYMVMPNGATMAGMVRGCEVHFNTTDSSWHIKVSTRPAINPPRNTLLWYTGLKVAPSIPSDDRAQFCISTDQYNTIKETGYFEYEGQYLAVVSTDYPGVYNADGKRLRAIIAENNTGSIKVWLLDNPFFPLILKTEGSSFNSDIELITIN